MKKEKDAAKILAEHILKNYPNYDAFEITGSKAVLKELAKAQKNKLNKPTKQN